MSGQTDITYTREFSLWLKVKAEQSGIPDIRISVSTSRDFPVFVSVVRDSQFFEAIDVSVDRALQELRAKLDKHEQQKKPLIESQA